MAAIRNIEKNIDYSTYTSKLQNKNDNVGTTVLVTFVGLYLGIIFLLASAAILALKSLSHTIDSQERYQILKKIGTDPKDISRSLFVQNLFLFVTPLLLAIIHSVAGMKFVTILFGTTKEFLRLFQLNSIAELPKLDEDDQERFELAR